MGSYLCHKLTLFSFLHDWLSPVRYWGSGGAKLFLHLCVFSCVYMYYYLISPVPILFTMMIWDSHTESKP